MKQARRIKCPRCGEKYTAGAPHEQFCRGRVPKGAKCIVCGNAVPASLLQCRCGSVVCDACKESDEHRC